MSEKEVHLRTLIYYYGLHGWFKSMQSATMEGVRLFPGDIRFRFLYAVSILYDGRAQECMRELDSIQEQPHMTLACTLALIASHKRLKSTDPDTVRGLEQRVREVRKNTTERSLYLSSLFLLLNHQVDKAMEYCDKLLSRFPDSKEGKILRAWIGYQQLHQSPGSMEEKDLLLIGHLFSDSSGDLEADFGKCLFLGHTGQCTKALSLLSDLSTRVHAFPPLLVEKMKISLRIRDWDAAFDCSTRSITGDRHSIEGLRVAILHGLVWSPQDEGSLLEKLTDLNTSLDLREPKAAFLYLETGRMISRLCQGKEEILRFTISLVERSSYIDSSSGHMVTCLVELGKQNLLLNRSKDAFRLFTQANQMNPNHLGSLVGLLHCALAEDPDDQNSITQLETLEELNRSTEPDADLLYLCAVCMNRRGKETGEIISFLNRLVKLELSSSSSQDYPYLKMNPILLHKVANLFLSFVPFEPITSRNGASGSNTDSEMVTSPEVGLVIHCLNQADKTLQFLSQWVPYHTTPSLSLARVHFLTGNLSGALALVDTVLERDDSLGSAYLLKGRILLEMGQHKLSELMLDSALSRDFSVREEDDFVIVKALILKHLGNLEEAVTLLKSSLQKRTPSGAQGPGSKGVRSSTIFSGFKGGLGAKTRTTMSFREKQFRITASLILAQVLDLMDQHGESEKILYSMEEELKGSHLEGRIMIAKAASSERRGHLDEALTLLRSIPPSDIEFFVTSRHMMANIYLTHRKDRRLYASCYKELVDHTKSKESYLLLGDAYMNILEPELAVESYEACLKKNPRDSELTRKVGEALVKGHLFEKAITYYKASIKVSQSDNNLTVALKYDLASLMFRLNRMKEAKDIIQSAMDDLEMMKETSGRSPDLSAGSTFFVTEWEAKFTFLLAKVTSNTSEGKETVITCLKKGYSLQASLVQRIRIEKPDAAEEHKVRLIEIGTMLAQLLTDFSRNYTNAIAVYKQLLNLNNRNVTILSALANLELLQNNFEAAQSYTSAILRHAPDDDESILMMTGMMINRNDHEGAYDQLKLLLDKKPGHCVALIRFIEVGRKIGKLQATKQMLDLAESQPKKDQSKYSFAKGLYDWYTGDSGSAIRCFFRSRTDPLFGKKSLLNMIDIYLNPENEVIGGGIFPSNGPSPDERQLVADGNVKTASKLLDDLQNRFGDSLDYHYYKAFCFYTRRHRNDIDHGIQGFNDILREDGDNSAALFGFATGQALSGQNQKAKQALKRLFKFEWKQMDGEIYERACLLMADLYLQSGKTDPAKSFLEKAMMQNRSSIRTFDYIGYISEKDGNYADASDSFGAAFDLGNRRNPILGYKYAMSLLLSKSFSKAVDVGREILVKFPDYPRIREEIVQKGLTARFNRM